MSGHYIEARRRPNQRVPEGPKDSFGGFLRNGQADPDIVGASFTCDSKFSVPEFTPNRFLIRGSLRGIVSHSWGGLVFVRNYRDEDAAVLMELFHETVHRVCSVHYTREQIEAWAPRSEMDVERWRRRLTEKRPFVGVAEGRIVGFIELDPDGHIDGLYVHHELQRKGVGSVLLKYVLGEARLRGIRRLYSEVSITARPFFERHAFSLVREQQVERRGQKLTNYIMERSLDGD